MNYATEVILLIIKRERTTDRSESTSEPVNLVPRFDIVVMSSSTNTNTPVADVKVCLKFVSILRTGDSRHHSIVVSEAGNTGRRHSIVDVFVKYKEEDGPDNTSVRYS